LLVNGFGVQGAAIGFAVMQGLLALFVTVTAFRSFDLPWFEVPKAIGAVLQSTRYATPLNIPSR
jgi:hypothetical protein